MLQLWVMLVEQVVEDPGTAAKNNQTDEQNYPLYFHIKIYIVFSGLYNMNYRMAEVEYIL